VQTSLGPVDVEQVVVAVGPWIASLWSMLGLPDRLDVRRPGGSLAENLPMWTYWYL
jgi:glycine/D-amino acid oxidase-like deaminating enzyme